MAETEIKTINGMAIADTTARAEIETLKGSAPGLVFDTKLDMDAYIAENAASLNVGQDLYIRAENEPDYWWDGTAAVAVEARADLSGYATVEQVETLETAIANLESKIPTEVGGMTAAQISALDGMLKIASFTEDPTAAYSAFKTAFGIEDSGEVEPDEPDTEVTLASISATYSGGDVAVGTALTDLTGIVVTATYSDGSTATVTDYKLSGTISEGSNTITVSYGGQTTNFTVTGIAESEGENNGWTEGEAYAIEWTDGYKLDSLTGAETEDAVSSVSDFLPCQNATRMVTSNLKNNYVLWYYDADKNFLRKSPTSNVVNQTNIETYRDAYYVRSYKALATTNASITPYRDDLLDATTAWEAGKYYRLDWKDGVTIDNTTGEEQEIAGNATSGLAMCYGATVLQFSNASRTKICWYDADKNLITTELRQNVTTAVAIADGAVYFRLNNSTVDGGCNFWVQLS